MKIKSILVAVLLMAGVVVAPANAAEKPVVQSFKFTPNEIDLTAVNTNVEFELVVSHSDGIENQTSTVSLENSIGYKMIVIMNRTDSPIDVSRKIVTFRGTLAVPRDVQPGAYVATASEVRSGNKSTQQYGTGAITIANFRDLVGGENALLVKRNASLGLDYLTFVGPSYNTTTSISYIDIAKYSANNSPILRVGEMYNPSDYFEVQVKNVKLEVTTATPSICSTDGTLLKFLAEGRCAFTVFTRANSNYLLKSSDQAVTVGSARAKATLTIEKLANLDFSQFPKQISVPWVYGPTQNWILPQSITPGVCGTATFYVNIYSGGICSLTYQVAANSSFLASDLYTQSFEILKDGKSVVVPTPTPTPTPVATPTPTAKPVVKKTITCVKGKKTIKKTAVSPKCPAGYKLKK